MKTKKRMLLMLILLVWGAASVNAQVTIGADRAPATTALEGALAYSIDNDSIYHCTGSAWVGYGAGKEYGVATTTNLGLVKTGTAATTNIAVADDGTISVPAASTITAGVITSEEKSMLLDLTSSMALRNIVVIWYDCKGTASQYGWKQTGTDLCWAPYDSNTPTGFNKQFTWLKANNGVTCPSPWRLPTIYEMRALYAAARPATGNGFTAPVMETLTFWTSSDFQPGWAFSWYKGADSGMDGAALYNNYYHVRCVRYL